MTPRHAGVQRRKGIVLSCQENLYREKVTLEGIRKHMVRTGVRQPSRDQGA